jgi:nitroreductase
VLRVPYGVARNERNTQHVSRQTKTFPRTAHFLRSEHGFSELIQQRYSVRAYKPDPVEKEKLQQVLEAARLAPSAANRQPFQLIVVRTAGREEELRRVYHRSWFSQAPLVIAICGLPDRAWPPDGQNYNM